MRARKREEALRAQLERSFCVDEDDRKAARGGREVVEKRPLEEHGVEDLVHDGRDRFVERVQRGLGMERVEHEGPCDGALARATAHAGQGARMDLEVVFDDVHEENEVRVWSQALPTELCE